LNFQVPCYFFNSFFMVSFRFIIYFSMCFTL